jgi:hypothetical protein
MAVANPDGGGETGMCVHTTNVLMKSLHDAAGRPHLLEVRTAGTRSNATTLVDASKVTLVFCEKVQCAYEPPHDCYCCLPELMLCYYTWSDCRAACARCDPKCPPAESPSPL